MRLGTTGLKVSRICLGMMSYGDPGWRDWVLGEETADMYSLGASEEVTGRLLSKYFAKRDDYVLASGHLGSEASILCGSRPILLAHRG